MSGGDLGAGAGCGGAGCGGAGRPLVIAVGNRFRGDDGVGPAVLDVLSARPETIRSMDLLELDGEPTRLVDAWDGRSLAVVVDAVRTGDGVASGGDPGRAAGRLVVLAGGDAVDPAKVARWTPGVSGHSTGVGEAIRLAEVLERLPDDLSIVGVEITATADGPGLSQQVAAAVEGAADEVCRLVGTWVSAGPDPAGSLLAGGADVPG